MKIKSIKLKFSNPSMGPHETVTEYWLDTENYQAEVDKLIEGSSVNNSATLHEYLAARTKEPSQADRALVERVAKAGPDLSNLPVGGTIARLELKLDDDQVVTFGKHSGLVLSGTYASFRAYIIEHGNKNTSNPWDAPGPSIGPSRSR